MCVCVYVCARVRACVLCSSIEAWLASWADVVAAGYCSFYFISDSLHALTFTLRRLDTIHTTAHSRSVADLRLKNITNHLYGNHLWMLS